MKQYFGIAVGMVAGAALGATTMHGLDAQAKLKAYSISENVITDEPAVAKYLPAVRKAIADNHGKSLLTLRGRVVPIEGAAPPSNVGIVEWDSVDDAVAFFKSPAWKAFDAEREKAQKTTTRFVVEVEKESIEQHAMRGRLGWRSLYCEGRCKRDVRYWPKADMAYHTAHVRFRG